MTTTLRCTDLRKVYPGQDDYALGDEATGASLEVMSGELFALLGPSGCGKTTTLRIIGGFVSPTTGRVEIDGREMTGKAPYERPTNTVFQSYALFPHMDVAENVAFGLKMARVGRAERQERVREALHLVGLDGMGGRRVSELSGGQQQRAALARAIVKRPAVLLLDEPLGALDLKLRRQMQDELVSLKRTTGTTFVHVTHDQEEACAIADRIAVMRDGHVIQVDTPVALYRAPRTSYVAGFIDAGTILRGAVKRTGDVFELSGPGYEVRGPSRSELNGSTAIAALIPRDRIKIRPAASHDGGSSGPGGMSGVIDRALFTGSVYELQISLSDGVQLQAAVPLEHVDTPETALVPGDPVQASWRPEDVVFVEDDDVAES